MRMPIVDSRLRVALEGDFPSRCTIQTVTFTASASNQQVPTGATNISGMVGIRCRIGPLIEIRPQDDEIRDKEIESRYERRQCKLDGYFPQIVNRTMQAVIDGLVWEIRGVEHDGNKLFTRLKLEITQP